MKELPATILLRPFNFETLSTTVSHEVFEDAALSALAIVLAGLIPIVVLARTSSERNRPSGRRRASA